MMMVMMMMMMMTVMVMMMMMTMDDHDNGYGDGDASREIVHIYIYIYRLLIILIIITRIIIFYIYIYILLNWLTKPIPPDSLENLWAFFDEDLGRAPAEQRQHGAVGGGNGVRGLDPPTVGVGRLMLRARSFLRGNRKPAETMKFNIV